MVTKQPPSKKSYEVGEYVVYVGDGLIDPVVGQVKSVVPMLTVLLVGDRHQRWASPDDVRETAQPKFKPGGIVKYYGGESGPGGDAMVLHVTAAGPLYGGKAPHYTYTIWCNRSQKPLERYEGDLAPLPKKEA
jgi:hypothetical protein